jgi:oligoribonuclease NrnB/cAMP/cGMP phosphodiesterase (DHH superfamily)
MRIVTRPDFDGVVCAALLFDALEIHDPVIWVEPNPLQKGRVEIRKGDIIANLPYDDRCSLWFDHHYTNRIRRPFRGAFEIAPSAAGIIFKYYKDRFKRDYSELAAAADKIDSADLTLDEVLHPEKYAYVLLSMTVFDGDHPDENYWNKLLELLRNFDIQQVLDDPDVSRRCRDVITQNLKYSVFLKEHTRLEGHVAITDFRQLERIPVGNRYLVYSLFPEAVVHVRIRYDDRRKQEIIVNVGHSIFNRNCKVNAGLLLSDFGGGGHRGAGSARFPASKASGSIPRIVDALLKNENNETG